MRPTRRLPLALAALLVVGCSGDGEAPEQATDRAVEVEPDDGSGAPLEDDPSADDAELDDEGLDEAPATDAPTERDPGTDDDPGPDDDAGPDDADLGDEGDGAADRGEAPQVPALHPQIDDLDEIVVTISTSDDDVRVDAKLAADTADRQRGLMEVTDLPGGVGMLFLFEEERRGGFWMKDTLVPLDIAYSSEDGEILEILTMEPCEADPCPSYDPEVAYLTALEVPAGWFDEVGVTTGDELTWSDPVPASASTT